VARRYRVELSARAEHDLDSIQAFIARDKPGAASKWVREIHRQIRSLNSMPQRFEIIPEVDNLNVEYRHIIYGNYRVIDRIRENRVHIIRVLHAAQIVTEVIVPPD
jgi:plasmid stabilization system protein ParE